MASNGSTIIAVGPPSTYSIMYSIDNGYVWAPALSLSGNTSYGIAYGNGLFVATLHQRLQQQ